MIVNLSHLKPVTHLWLATILMLLLGQPAARAASPWDFNLEWISLNGEYRAQHVAMEGSRLYLANTPAGSRVRLTVLNVSNPYSIEKLGDLEFAANEYRGSIMVSRSYVYVAMDASVQIIDARNPAGMQKVAAITEFQNILTLDLHNDLLLFYHATTGSSIPLIAIYDVSSPAVPVRLGSITGMYPFTCTDHLLITGDQRIYDLTRPEAPVQIVAGAAQLGALQMITNGNYVLSAGFKGTIDYYRIDIPAGLTHLARYSTPDSDPVRVGFLNGMVFSGGSWGIQAMDAAQPIPPNFLRGAYYVPGAVTGMAIDGEFIYAVDPGNGLLVLRYTGEWPQGSLYDAEIIEYDGPRELAPGQIADAQLRVKNTGPFAWTGDAGYKIAILEDNGQLNDYAFPRVNIPAGVKVPPGTIYSFPLRLHAPAETGNYTIRFQMVREFHEFFGEQSEVSIEVAQEHAAIDDWTAYP